MSLTEEEAVEVEPVKRYERNGETYKERYSFSEVHIDEIDREGITTSGVETKWADNIDGLAWQYRGKPPVVVGRHTVYAHPRTGIRESKRQAYFAVSILESMGLVSGWHQKTT